MKRIKKTVKIGDVIHTEGRVIPAGENSLAVTLPKSWTREHGIKAGDTVVKVANSILTISIKKR